MTGGWACIAARASSRCVRLLGGLGFLLGAFAPAAFAQGLEAPEPQRGRVALDGQAVGRGGTAVDPLERLRAVYLAHPAPPGSAGDVLVLDPEGEPHAGATVALLGGAWETGDAALLEHGLSDGAGRVHLSQLALASRVALWSDALPAVVLEGDLLAEHRRAAGDRALVVQLDASDVLEARITVDGRVPEEGEVHPYVYFQGWVDEEWPVIRHPLEPLLRKLDPPGRQLRVLLGESGGLHVDRFRWPASRFKPEPAPASLYVTDEDLFRADAVYGKGVSRFDLRAMDVERDGPPAVLRLEHGVWVRGRVRIAGLAQLPGEMELRFGLPKTGKKEEQVEVESDGTFRFAVPSELFDLDLEVRTGLTGRDGLRRFAFPVPDPAPVGTWDLGVLELVLERSSELRVLDPTGAPIAGAQVSYLDPRFGPSLPPPLAVDLAPDPNGFQEREATGSDRDGRLLVRTPRRGEEVWVDHAAYDRARVLWSDVPVQTVVLQPAARLLLTARIPEGFPPERLLVQLEATREVFGLVRGSRSLMTEQALAGFSSRIAEGLYDARSNAAWSYTSDFWRAREEEDPAEAGAWTLVLRAIHPGVPFHLRVFDPAGGVFLDAQQEPFYAGEQRRLRVELPAQVRWRRGRIVQPDGAPGAGRDVSFGAPIPVAIGKTEQNGEFAFPVLEDAPGTVLAELAGTWIACGEDGSSTGRMPTSCARWSEVRFAPGRTTELVLEPLRELHITPVCPNGDLPRSIWRVEVTDSDTGLLLGAFDGSFGYSLKEVTTLHLPRGLPLLATASLESTRVQRAIGPDEDDVRLELPPLGAIELTIDAFPGVRPGRWARVLLRPKQGGTPIVRLTSASASEVLPDLPPGAYTLTAFLDPEVPGEELRESESADVVVVAGAVARLTLR